MKNKVLELKKIAKVFPDGKKGFRTILKGIDLSLTEGEILGIMGPSGVGKSTLLHIAGSLEEPSQGEILLQGEEINGLGEHDLAVLRNGTFGFIFQDHYLMPQLSVRENLLLPSKAFPKTRAEREEIEAWGKHLLEILGMIDLLKSPVSWLSGGERQRLAAARALIMKPKLLLADEPTGALDEPNAQKLMDFLKKMVKDQDRALLLVTHSPEIASYCDITRRLHQGLLEES